MTRLSTKQAKSTTKITSLNAHSLNIPEKRSQLHLSKCNCKADIIFLQETHFKVDSTPKLSNIHIPTSLHAANQASKSKVVSILFVKHCLFQVTDTYLDEEGCYIFVKGSLFRKRLMVTNIYAANVKQVPFFRSTLQILSALGGDFNVPLNPLHDTSSGTSTLP